MTTSITAAIVSEPGGPFSLETVDLDDPRNDEVLIRVEACGVCHTDQAAQRMVSLPAVFGHEGTGVVEAVGKGVTRFQKGDRVIVSYPSCGDCPQCIEGKAYICRHTHDLCFGGSRPDGSKPVSLGGKPLSSAFFQQSTFATKAIVPERSLIKAPDEIPSSLRAAIPCGVQTGAGAVINTFKAAPGDSLVVFGAGAVGLSAVMAGRLVGLAPLIAVDIVEERLNLALELGATHVIHAAKGDTLARIMEIAPHGVAYALETSSQAESFNSAIQCLGMGGVCGTVTPPNANRPIDFSPGMLLEKGTRLWGVIQGSSLPKTFLPKLLELNRQGSFPVERLIKTYPFEEINRAMADSLSGRTIKPVLTMPSP